MNKARRAELSLVAEMVEQCRDHVDALQRQEEEAFDNLPESLQDSERGSAMQEAISSLEEASGDLQSAWDCLAEAEGGS